MGREKAAIVFGETSTGPGMKSLSCGGIEELSTLNPPVQGDGAIGAQSSSARPGGRAVRRSKLRSREELALQAFRMYPPSVAAATYCAASGPTHLLNAQFRCTAAMCSLDIW